VKDFHQGGGYKGDFGNFPTGFGKIKQGQRADLFALLPKKKPHELSQQPVLAIDVLLEGCLIKVFVGRPFGEGLPEVG
jgi:hypothetical protein